MENNVTDLNIQAFQGKLEKIMGIFKISSLQTEAKKYEELISNSAKLSYPEQQLKMFINNI